MSEHVALSFSRLNTFEQCPAKFDYLYISKVVKDEFNEASDYGNRVHKTLEQYGRGQLNMGELSLEQRQTIERWGGLVDKLMDKPGVKMFEKQMCIGKDLQKLDWFSKQAYIRAIADLLIVDGKTAYCFDYKTGKVKEDDTQLKMFAAVVMQLYPEVDTVKTAYIWLMHDKITPSTYSRDYLSELWESINARTNEVFETVELGFYEAKPSGLCPWCPARKICPSANLRGR